MNSKPVIKIGDRIQVIDRGISSWPISGVVLELDSHPLDASYARILVDSPANPAPEIWINLRLARLY